MKDTRDEAFLRYDKTRAKVITHPKLFVSLARS